MLCYSSRCPFDVTTRLRLLIVRVISSGAPTGSRATSGSRSTAARDIPRTTICGRTTCCIATCGVTTRRIATRSAGPCGPTVVKWRVGSIARGNRSGHVLSYIAGDTSSSPTPVGGSATPHSTSGVCRAGGATAAGNGARHFLSHVAGDATRILRNKPGAGTHILRADASIEPRCSLVVLELPPCWSRCRCCYWCSVI
jgi:hypothetical protein